MTPIARATDINRLGNKLKAPYLRIELNRLEQEFMGVRAKPLSQDQSVCFGQQIIHDRRHGVLVKLRLVS